MSDLSILQEALKGWELWWEDATRDEQIIVDAAKRWANLHENLAHYLTKQRDPCQDRGVEWPCDVAETLGIDPPEDT